MNHDELVMAIGQRLRPWKCPQREVLAEITWAIDEVRRDLKAKAWLSEVGVASENKRRAKACYGALDKARKVLDAALQHPSFIKSLTLASCEGWKEGGDSTPEERELRAELTVLLAQISKASSQCGRVVQYPSGVIPNQRVDKTRTAFVALCLIKTVSKKSPTVGEGNTAFCDIASWLFEDATGAQEPEERNLERACKEILQMDRAEQARRR